VLRLHLHRLSLPSFLFRNLRCNRRNVQNKQPNSFAHRHLRLGRQIYVVVECFDNARHCSFWEHDFRHLMFWTILSLALVLQFGQA
jgi:hypothetical protein